MANVSNFEDQSYWNERYSQPKAKSSFDWYLVSFAMIRSCLCSSLQTHLLSADNRNSAGVGLVDLGCGNSSLLSDMINDAEFRALAASLCSPSRVSSSRVFVGIDYSPPAVDRQRDLLAGVVDAEVYVADARHMENVLGNSSVACVIDKATLDCIDCSGQAEDGIAVVREVHRVLIPGGLFVVVTCRPVPRRKETIASVEGFAVVSVVCLENDPIAPSHVMTMRKV
jgi:SAM-dependent methyltransferase